MNLVLDVEPFASPAAHHAKISKTATYKELFTKQRFNSFNLEFFTVELPKSASTLKTYDAKSVQADDEWQNEIYEANPQKYFQKFAFHVSFAPEALVLYDFGGSPLWYSKPERIPKCHCGSVRMFEYQLLPHLLVTLGVDIHLGLDFGSILVFVCEQDCQANETNWTEEYVIVQGDYLNKL